MSNVATIVTLQNNTMESALEAILDKLASPDDVQGVLIADEHGLCLGGVLPEAPSNRFRHSPSAPSHPNYFTPHHTARGVAKPASAGSVASIALHARDLTSSPRDDDKFQYPTVCVETTNSTIIIRNEGAYTLAIFKEGQ
ncbi:hypothetical protein BC938DRAFT_484224 [Jimgerdemannia flammicorona]|uniref:Late endosomal/lysosomal adaptor and MAPK and MTOR activator 5 n=1 Tax=Jimgerdemannia flammicorona TaxID=994334 RepID=A0A433QAC1_9FUNG|nr:hypothetical protein BC938DRAFT_484224 [Jimgerdemannia flammicorona]